MLGLVCVATGKVLKGLRSGGRAHARPSTSHPAPTRPASISNTSTPNDHQSAALPCPCEGKHGAAGLGPLHAPPPLPGHPIPSPTRSALKRLQNHPACLVQDDLGGQVVWRAAQCVCAPTAGQALGKPKVGHLDVPRPVKEQIFGLLRICGGWRARRWVVHGLAGPCGTPVECHSPPPPIPRPLPPPHSTPCPSFHLPKQSCLEVAVYHARTVQCIQGGQHFGGIEACGWLSQAAAGAQVAEKLAAGHVLQGKIYALRILEGRQQAHAGGRGQGRQHIAL